MNQTVKDEYRDKLFSLCANGRVSELRSLLSGMHVTHLPPTVAITIHRSLPYLVSGVDVNTCNRRGWTPLMFAARNGHTDAIKELLENG